MGDLKHPSRKEEEETESEPVVERLMMMVRLAGRHASDPLPMCVLLAVGSTYSCLCVCGRGCVCGGEVSG